MQRRTFLKKTAKVAAWSAGAAATACAKQESSPAIHTNPNIVWRLTSSFPRGLDTIFGSNEVLAQRCEAMSNGRFKIRTYSSGELVPGLQVLDAIQQGTVQVGQTASYYFIGKNPAFAFDACVPFGLTSRQQTSWLGEGGGRELLAGMFADFNIKSFSAGNTGVQMGGWFQKELHSLGDLRGLKMRIPGLGGQVMDRLGATVQVLAGSDIYPALERGVIDATEWVGPYDDEKLGFYKIAKLYYYPGWWEPGPNLSYYVNLDAWNKLPSNYQAIFQAAATESAVAMQARYDAKNPGALVRLLQHGVQMQPFPEDIMLKAEQESLAILEEEAAKDASYRKILDHWKKARRESFDWFRSAELSYGKFAFRALKG